MIDKYAKNTRIFDELPEEKQGYWFDYKRQKFLHNIDTLYYTVKLNCDFSSDTLDERVLKFRKFFKSEFDSLNVFDKTYISDHLPKDLILSRSSFAGVYNIRLELSDCFDIFMAYSVPNNDTSEILVQIRAYFLWIYGAKIAFDKSFERVKDICSLFDFDILAVKENRVDFCWHTNYIQDVKSFLNPEKVANMRVSTLGRDGDIHLEFDGDCDYEVDYFRFGRKASNNVIFRIYLKSKEVVEQGYKAFFFKIWLLHGLISRYDLYVYEECFKMRSWGYKDKARLKFYCEYGSDDLLKNYINENILGENCNPDYDTVKNMADILTPKITLILNFEFQTMRKFSSTLVLTNFKYRYGVVERIYTYLDNRKLIIDYLTDKVFRFVDYDPERDSNKSRCQMTNFWQRLRSVRLVDCYCNIHDIKLVRSYSNRLSYEMVKKRTLSSIATADVYVHGTDVASASDCFLDFLSLLNDNDIKRFNFYREKHSRILKGKVFENSVERKNNLCLLDKSSGELIL